MMIITLCDKCARKLSAAYYLRKRGGLPGRCSLCGKNDAEDYNAQSKTAPAVRPRQMSDYERDAARKRRWA